MEMNDWRPRAGAVSVPTRNFINLEKVMRLEPEKYKRILFKHRSTVDSAFRISDQHQEISG